MGQLFANNVEMQLASNLGANDTSFTAKAGQGSQCPVIAANEANFFLLTFEDKNGNKEVVKVIEHLSGSDVFTIGDDESVPHVASVNGRAYEPTFDGYQTALAITATDAHKIRMPITAKTFQDCVGVITGSGVTNADLQKLVAITESAANINNAANLLNPANRAIGDLITKISSGAMGAISSVATGSYLKSAGEEALPAWGKWSLADSGFKFDISAITDSSSRIVTGVGFRPALVIFVSGGSALGIGFDNGTLHQYYGEGGNSKSYSLYLSGKTASISAKSSDGFTVTASGSISGSAYFAYLALP